MKGFKLSALGMLLTAALFLNSFAYAIDDYKKTQLTTQPDITAVLTNDPNLSTFVAALQAADLMAILQGHGPFTLFAPSNDAFTALGKRRLNDLMKPQNKEELKKILLTHVIPGLVTTETIKDMDSETSSGQIIKIRTTDGGTTVNNSKIIQPEKTANNGVVLVIDQVLIPTK